MWGKGSHTGFLLMYAFDTTGRFKGRNISKVHPLQQHQIAVFFPSSLLTNSFAILSPSPKCSLGYGRSHW